MILFNRSPRLVKPTGLFVTDREHVVTSVLKIKEFMV